MMSGARPCKQILILNRNHIWYSPLLTVSQWQECKIRFSYSYRERKNCHKVIWAFEYISVLILIDWFSCMTSIQKPGAEKLCQGQFFSYFCLNMADGLYLIWCKTRQQKGKENRECYVVAFMNSSNFRLLLVLQKECYNGIEPSSKTLQVLVVRDELWQCNKSLCS